MFVEWYNHICLPLKPNLFIPKLDLFGGTSAFLPDSYKIKQDIPIPRICNPATRFRKTCYKNCDILWQVFKVFPPSFWYAYPSFEEKHPSLEECPQKSFRSFSLSANSLFMGFPAEGLAFKILQPGIYSFSRHIRFFSYGCVLFGIFGVFPMYLRAFHLPAIGHAEGFFFSLKDFEVSILQPECRWTKRLRRGWNFWRKNKCFAMCI